MNFHRVWNISISALAAFAVLLFASHLFAQNKEANRSRQRGLKVSNRASAPQPEQEVKATDPATASDKPQLVVQLGHTSSISKVIFSPDGRLVLTTADSLDGNAILWDLSTGKELRRFIGHTKNLLDLAFSSDGRFVLTGGHDQTARLWDAATGAELKRFAGPMGVVSAVAFSPDGRFVLTGSASYYRAGRKIEDDMVRVWDAATGRLVRSFKVPLPVTFSPDGRHALTGGEDHIARLWDVATGQEIRRFAGHSSPVLSLAFSPDSRFILTKSAHPYDEKAPQDKSMRVWDAATGKEIRRFDKAGHALSMSPDGRYLFTSANDEDFTALLLDMTTGEEVGRYKIFRPLGFSPDGRFMLTAEVYRLLFWSVETRQLAGGLDAYSSSIVSAAISADGHFLLTGSHNKVAQLWDATTGQQIQRYGSENYSGSVDYVAFSRDGRFALTRGGDSPGSLRDVATGEEIHRFKGHPKYLEQIALSPDGRHIFTGGFDNPARLWDAATGQEARRFIGYPGSVEYVAFSPDGRFVLTVSNNKEPWRWACLWDTNTGKEIRRFKVPMNAASSFALSPDNRFLLAGGPPLSQHGNNANMFDLTTGRHLRSFVGHSSTVSSVEFSPDGRYVLTGSWDHTARLWDAVTGRQIRVFKGHSNSVWSAAFSSDGRHVLTGSLDSTTRFWRTDTGQELCRLVSFNDGSWIVVTPEGRFDTNNLDEIKGLHWVMPDDPFRPLPAEIFMRDYYEPRLLPRIMAGEKFKPIKSLSELNRVQPKVKIADIQLQPNAQDRATITVEVSGAEGELQRGNKQVALKTGVYDLRLFRDGQLVGYAPKEGGEIAIDHAAGKQLITFRNVKIPRKKGVAQVEFSAYAFNVDRVKSATDRRVVEVPKNLSPIKGRAYLVTVGVNAYEDANFDLSFAANDARRIQAIVSDKLSRSGEYEEIVQIPLISDYETRGGQRVITENTAVKNNLKTVLDILAGKYVNVDLKNSIPNADKLRQARPEDLVLISFSSHGFADDNGNFYFVTYDTGQVKGQGITEDFMARCISSEELSLWLRDVDAGEMVMIADACHSAATVDTEGFKPGPMGSRGLGQLAYDKGMRILTSTQANDVALESALIKQGLLTYALTHDGIEAGQADFKPKDNVITLAEWLEYGVKRVPMLYQEVKQGTLQDFGRGKETRGLVVLSNQKTALTDKSAYQRPSLFDFARKKQEVTLVK